jgi:transcriptional regulator with XRE-family HTH domain
MSQSVSDRNHELAEFLRSRRARLSPQSVGLPAVGRRRTPGLRREEVAILAGISPEWYTWLEQGRDINVSVPLLESVARTLRLNADEREHLFLLAQGQPPPLEKISHTTISPTLQAFIEGLNTSPACVVDARLNAIAWNRAFCAVFGDYARMSERERNLIWRLFASPARQGNEQEWEEHARVYLAQFRAEYGRFINDPWWTEQIVALSRLSPEFRELWARHDVLNVPEGRKSMLHPMVGALSFDFLFFQLIDPANLKLLIHTPRKDSNTAEKIEQLLAHT